MYGGRQPRYQQTQQRAQQQRASQQTQQRAPQQELQPSDLGPNATEVVPRLWIGDMFAAQDANFMKRNNIQAVLNATPDIPNLFADHGVEYMRLEINDNLEPIEIKKMADYLPHAISFIYKNRDIDNKNVLVHCHAGRQRSAACVAAYLKKVYDNKDIEEIIKFIVSKRPQCFHWGQSVNFWEALKDL